ncbi:MAG: hypothetical protein MJ201_01155 [Mycoplasmoidaceae bacterium]|nr:hypothetical protein [Mycoplasmoidaceae bacterium]MCQ3914412.1 hypothetical protein [Mycoplasmoidaceae bacterium]
MNGDTVRYGDYRELSSTLKYDLNEERHFDYSHLNQDEIIQHIAIFISNL